MPNKERLINIYLSSVIITGRMEIFGSPVLSGWNFKGLHRSKYFLERISKNFCSPTSRQKNFEGILKKNVVQMLKPVLNFTSKVKKSKNEFWAPISKIKKAEMSFKLPYRRFTTSRQVFERNFKIIFELFVRIEPIRTMSKPLTTCKCAVKR
ncbi:hypothetical protein RhiirA4_483121 [Rhizophagus irregularis]|uniref:Uncharacterized protein n=1 Tax=Rhizophagus irregularis TaxID=588596 RepID=A0A2I1HM53_9GLOM|nr:hypothetical protein RhiirA4_483121 [Rhizophagus irregularis]